MPIDGKLTSGEIKARGELVYLADKLDLDIETDNNGQVIIYTGISRKDKTLPGDADHFEEFIADGDAFDEKV